MGDELMWRTGTMKTKLRRRLWQDEDVKEDEDQYKRTNMKVRMTVTEIDYMSVMIYKILLWLNWCHHHHQPDAHTQGPFKYIHIHFGRAGWKHNLPKQCQQFTIMIVSKLSTVISQTSKSVGLWICTGKWLRRTMSRYGTVHWVCHCHLKMLTAREILYHVITIRCHKSVDRI